MSNAPHSFRVLIIDDNKAIHDDIRKVLAPLDGAQQVLSTLAADLFDEAKPAPPSGTAFDIDSAYQGQEGLAKVEAARAEGRPYALAFVDVRMPPGWDGVETVGHLWQCDPSLQVVLCTAYSDYDWNGITEKIETADRLVILRKPFDNIEVIQLAHALTRKWQLQRDLEGRLANLEHLVDERTKALTDAHTARERLEVQLRLSQKLESVGRLANGIAHEMNSPLQYVVSNVAFLRTAFDDLRQLIAACGDTYAAVNADAQLLTTEVESAFDATSHGLERMAALVRSMKEFAQPEQQARTMTNINDAVKTTIGIARHEWHHVADVKTALDLELPQLVCMRSEINEVLLHLVVNAAHAIADKAADRIGEAGGATSKGTILVKTSADHAGAIVVSVSDTGTGIRDDIRDKIFDPFFTTKDVGRGAGQGLAVVWNIVTKHGGTVHFDSVLGEGSTFTVTLPVRPQLTLAA